MPALKATPDGFENELQRIECPDPTPSGLNEEQFHNWQRRWNSKEEVIDKFLAELENAMTQSLIQKRPVFRIVSQTESL